MMISFDEYGSLYQEQESYAFGRSGHIPQEATAICSKKGLPIR
jgi:hypothetical protein